MVKNSKLKKTVSISVAAALSLWSVLPASSALSTTDDGELTTSRSENSFKLIVPLVDDTSPVLLAFSSGATSSVIAPLNRAVAECQSVGAEYAASCAAAAYKKAAAAANRPDYRDAKRELRRTAKELDKLVAKNADKDAPTIRANGKTYRAVKKSTVSKVNQEAKKIITETQTKLLRSSGSGTRKTHYQRIAQAVGSTKKIFRS